MTMTGRAYSFIEVKAIDEEERVIEGIASTPSPDRVDDIVNPMGAKFKLPLPLLWQHDHAQPIGHVEMAKPTKDGIPFTARIAKTSEPGAVRERLDDAWQSIKLKLVQAVSIGFRPIKYSYLETGGIQFDEWEWFELSAVTIPANEEATISTVKAIDTALRKAEPDWRVGAERDLPISDSDEWDGAAAKERVLDNAGFNGDDPDPASARRAFLVYDSGNPDLKGSYKLPFADIRDGELRAVAEGLRAAASRLPQTDVPESERERARDVLDDYFDRLNDEEGENSRTGASAATGKTTRVVRLNDPARDRAKPFVIREIKR